MSKNDHLLQKYDGNREQLNILEKVKREMSAGACIPFRHFTVGSAVFTIPEKIYF